MDKEKKNVETGEKPAEETTKKKGTGRKVLNIIVNVLLVLAIIIVAISTYVSFVSTKGNGVPSILGIRILSIQTESMHPTLQVGDLIFERGIKNTADIRKDDIITYWTIIDGERVLNTHRVVNIYDGGEYLIFQTKGDNNTSEDPLTVHESELVGIYKGARIKGLGTVFDFLQTSTGFLIVIVIPVAIFFLWQLVKFFRVLFEYNNLKNKLLYEQERGRNEDVIEEEKQKFEETRKAEREKLEQELREKLRKEILEESAKTNAAPEETRTEQ